MLHHPFIGSSRRKPHESGSRRSPRYRTSKTRYRQGKSALPRLFIPRTRGYSDRLAELVVVIGRRARRLLGLGIFHRPEICHYVCIQKQPRLLWNITWLH